MSDTGTSGLDRTHCSPVLTHLCTTSTYSSAGQYRQPIRVDHATASMADTMRALANTGKGASKGFCPFLETLQ
jgi:hypothetical protein